MRTRITVYSARFAVIAVFAVWSCGNWDAGSGGPSPPPPPTTTSDAGPGRIQPSLPAPADDPDAALRLAIEMKQSAPDGNAPAVIEAFARAGITVLEDDGETPVQSLAASPSPFVFARSESAAFARELASGRGRPGAALDAFVPAGSAVSLSDVIVAYVRVAESFGARLSRALLTDQDLSAPHRVRLPSIVGALFLADVYPRVFWVDSHNKMILGAAAALRPACGVVDTLLSPVRGVFAGTLRENLSTELGGAMVREMAALRSLSEEAVQSALPNLVASFRMLAAEVHFAALFESWTVRLTGPTDPVHYRVAGTASADIALRVSATRGSSPPSWITACAAERGASLFMAEAANAPVTWRASEEFVEHASFVGATAGRLDDEGATSIAVRLNEESAAAHASGVTKSASFVVQCDVDRVPYDALGQTLASLLGDATARAVAAEYGADAFDRLAVMVAPSATALLQLSVTYHE